MNKKILLIEDDAVLLENVKELLEVYQHQVFTASNGTLGIHLAREKLPDLIISDIMMPGLDGYEVYETLQMNKNTHVIPFLFLSAKSAPADVRKGMNMGADDYITKPFKEEDLVSAVEKRLAKRAFLQRQELLPSKENESVEDLLGLISYFREHGEEVLLRKREDLYHEGRQASWVFLVETGLLKTFRLDEYGKELITTLPKKKEFFGFYGFKRPASYPESAQALERSSVYRISTEDFVSLLSNNQELTVQFAQILSENLAHLETHLLEMAYASVLKKTTNTILECAEKVQDNPRDFIKISRSDLASMAGISTESFIRSLSILKKDGLIDIVGRNIKIVDLKKLHEIK